MSDQNITADWIAADWGTSHLRVWAMQGATVLSRASSDDGMAKLDRDGFETALLRLVSGWLGTDPILVLACGMVGARQGWTEAPYQTVPAKPLAATPVPATAQDKRLRMYILPGMQQDTPADVMRGEETQAAGFLALNPNWDGILCLPGTHTKWVHVSAGEIVSFQTFMTGELFALLSDHSVLRHSVGGAGWNDEAFANAIDETLSRPEKLAASLFSLRANDLLHRQPAEVGRARLSGLLIGAELAAARPYWLGQQVALIGDTRITAPYAKALDTQSVPVTIADGTRMTLAGLTAAYRSFERFQ